MKVKTNVFYNGEHLGEELEEWFNEHESMRLVTFTLTERENEGRVTCQAVFDDDPFSAWAAKRVDEAANAHTEVGALSSVILEIYSALADPTSTDYAKVALAKTALSRCISSPEGHGIVLDMKKLLPPRG